MTGTITLNAQIGRNHAGHQRQIKANQNALRSLG
jgi:hypothetical protein